MPTITVMTCGTSLITNGIDEDLRGIVNKNTNTSRWDDIDASASHKLQCHLTKREQQLLSAPDDEVRKLSAELNGLLAWQQDNLTQASHRQNEYWLIATDTVLGKATAQMIKSWLEQRGHQTQVISASGLKTKSLIDFRHALSALTEQLVKPIKGYQDSGYTINFNLTGGFKGINGFLQALAMVYADQTYYLFEGSTELLYIPRLPYQLNAKQIINANITTFRRLAHNDLIYQGRSQDISDLWLFKVDDEYGLSEWGELIWQDAKPELYQSQILPAPSDSITISDAFISSCKKADAKTIQLINERIDDLAAYLESKSTKILKSLDVKALQAKKYKDQNLYECDLDDHQRIFMIKNGHHMTLTELHAALH